MTVRPALALAPSPGTGARDSVRPTVGTWLIWAAWLVPATLAGFEAYMQARLGNRPPVTWRNIVWEGGDWMIYAPLSAIVFRLGRLLPLGRRWLARNLAIHFAASLVLCAVWAGIGVLLRQVVLPGVAEPITVHDFVSWFFTSLPFGVAVYFAVLGIEHAVFYFLQARERETQAARLSAQLAEARLGALRMQLNPHFLFNSLNAITVLMRDQNTASAAQMLELLGEMLRQVLRTDVSHEITLAEEIEFLERYLAIERVRFSDRLRPIIDVAPGTLGAMVPSLLLQPLVENALRHGLARRTQAGLLTITAHREGDDLILSVRDDGPGLEPGDSHGHAGVGLANTRERLATLYGDRGRLELTSRADGGQGAVATVRLPYRISAAPGEVHARV